MVGLAQREVNRGALIMMYWYALRSKPHKERSLTQQLKADGVRVPVY